MLIWVSSVMCCHCCTWQSWWWRAVWHIIEHITLPITDLTYPGDKLSPNIHGCCFHYSSFAEMRDTEVKERGSSRAIFHPSVICFSFCIYFISLLGSFLIRRGHLNLPLTPTVLRTGTQCAIYSSSHNHSWNYHRAFLGVSSSLFLHAPAGLSLSCPEEGPSSESEEHHHTTLEALHHPRQTRHLLIGVEFQCPGCTHWETGSTWLEKAYEQ